MTGKECDVMYDKNNPNNSYIKRSGQIINCILGTFFCNYWNYSVMYRNFFESCNILNGFI